MNDDDRFENDNDDPYTYTPEELAAMEREQRELDAAYADDERRRADYIATVTDVATGKALALLLDIHGGDDCDGDLPAPTEVLSVLDTDGNSFLRARVRCADGTERTVTATRRYYPGNYECPSEVDTSYEYEEEGK